MNKKKKVGKIKKSKYFPAEYINDFQQDLKELEVEKEVLKERLTDFINMEDVFEVLNFDQKRYFYIHRFEPL